MNVVADDREEVPLGEVGPVVDERDVGTVVYEALVTHREVEAEFDGLTRFERISLA